MEDRKRPSKSPRTETPAEHQRRRFGKVVHDHKGNASVEWHDAPADHERPVFEIEGATQPARPAKRGLHTGSLAIATEDTYNPYTRVPESGQKGAPAKPRDLRRLSAWIKLMRQLEETKQKKAQERDDEE